jgi:hypothetical protein
VGDGHHRIKRRSRACHPIVHNPKENLSCLVGGIICPPPHLMWCSLVNFGTPCPRFLCQTQW